MARLRSLPWLVAMIALPLAASAGEMYSYVDEDGVIRVTNIPPTARVPVRAAPPRWSEASPRKAAASYDEHICAAAQRHRVPPPLLKAVMAVESNFDAAAVSPKGATGLMQLMPTTARDLAVDDVLDPRQNIAGGARYLRLLQERFDGDLEVVLAAYNAGPEAVRRAGGAIPPFRETREYVRRVLATRDRYARARWCGGVQPSMTTSAFSGSHRTAVGG
jgi:soluble lytic murein transglycosylase-like protein